MYTYIHSCWFARARTGVCVHMCGYCECVSADDDEFVMVSCEDVGSEDGGSEDGGSEDGGGEDGDSEDGGHVGSYDVAAEDVAPEVAAHLKTESDAGDVQDVCNFVCMS